MLLDDAEGEDEERGVIWRREAVEAARHTTAGEVDGASCVEWAAHVTSRRSDLGLIFPFGCIQVRKLNTQPSPGVVSSLSTHALPTNHPSPIPRHQLCSRWHSFYCFTKSSLADTVFRLIRCASAHPELPPKLLRSCQARLPPPLDNAQVLGSAFSASMPT
jgi:hypothetical protein